MTFIEALETRLQKRTKDKDKYCVRRFYHCSQSGYDTLKCCGDNVSETLFLFQQLVTSFDKNHTGHVEIFKNKAEKIIIRVNL